MDQMTIPLNGTSIVSWAERMTLCRTCKSILINTFLFSSILSGSCKDTNESVAKTSQFILLEGLWDTELRKCVSRKTKTCVPLRTQRWPDLANNQFLTFSILWQKRVRSVYFPFTADRLTRLAIDQCQLIHSFGLWKNYYHYGIVYCRRHSTLHGLLLTPTVASWFQVKNNTVSIWLWKFPSDIVVLLVKSKFKKKFTSVFQADSTINLQELLLVGITGNI
jgi:hypothetical protein